MRRRLLENFSLKVIAFVLSLALVVFVRGDLSAVETFELTLLVRQPRGHVLLSAREVPVRVRVRGTWSQLQKLNETRLGPISVSPPANNGKSQVFLSTDLLQLPPGLTVESFTPAAFEVSLEEEIRRIVPINVTGSLVGEVPPGYRLGVISVVPDVVELIGPSSLVEDIEEVRFESIDLKQHTRTFVTQREVVPAGVGVQANGVSRVSVRVEIVSDAQSLIIEGVPVVVLELSRPYEVLPEHVDVVLVGTDEALSRVDRASLAVVIDGSEESGQAPRSVQKRVTRANIPNLPPDVLVDDNRSQSVILRTFAVPPPQPPPPEPGVEAHPKVEKQLPEPP